MQYRIMEWLNYHHLLYFWTVAKEGSVTQASQILNLSQPTVSDQLRALEKSLGERLFERSGRKLVLTEVGRTVFAYADEIFSLGRELLDTVKGRPTGKPLRLAVGIADVLPKIIAYRLLEPALRIGQSIRLVCHENTHEKLMPALALHQIDLVLSDTPIGSGMKIRAFNHLLGESDVTVFGTSELAKIYQQDFPRSLNQAPFLMPFEGSTLRRSLENWFNSNGIRPTIIAEFEDSALLKVFGQTGAGLFCAPSVITTEIQRHYDVQSLGRIEEVRERFYAISPERRLKNPAAIAISEEAKHRLFG